MNEINYTIVGFEIIGIERLGTKPIHEQIETISLVLQKNGFALVPQTNSSKFTKCYTIHDRNLVAKLCKQIFGKTEEELIWLTTEFFQYFFLLLTKYDLLFGFVSLHDPEQLGLYGRNPSYILSEVGDYTYRPAIPRILISGALLQNGFHELGKNLECISSFPRETAMAGDIIFVEPPIKYNLKMKDTDTGFEWRTLSLLSSKSLSHEIVDLIQDESRLSHVEIAKVFPFQFFSVVTSGEEEYPFSLLNHFSIKARKGTCAEVLDELLGVSLHLNWTRSKEYAGELLREEALKYALIQNTRLKQVEKKEQELIYALNILEKRYPHNIEIIEWQVNNLYSNIMRFSPVYLSWKTHLQAFIQGTETVEYNFLNLLSQLDWQLLEKNGIANKSEGEQLVELLKISPSSTLIRIRVIVEKIVSFLFNQAFPKSSHNLTLSDKLQRLNTSKIFPPFINIYLNTLRLTGNIGAHEGEGGKEDVEAILPIFLRVIEWFLDKELKIN